MAPGASDTDAYGRSYFDSPHLTDRDSRFQRYRVRKVFGLHAPGPEDRVVDLGCGWGTVSLEAAKRAREVVGVDFAPEAVSFCTDAAKRCGAGNVSFRLANVCNTGLSAGHFDAAYAADLFEHLYPTESRAACEEAHRLLKPGGIFVVWMPCRSHFFEALKNRNIVLKADPTHVDYKSRGRMVRMLMNAGFRVPLAVYAESHWPVVSRAERLMMRRLPLFRRRIGIVAVKPDDDHGGFPVPAGLSRSIDNRTGGAAE
ncbi:MAG: class I SAM-dependent methyltransferase [Deltaproteobacteria bacterium]|nr:class I SAM-dependent methyltransferase [Deltaproteobacteria bacterium]